MAETKADATEVINETKLADAVMATDAVATLTTNKATDKTANTTTNAVMTAIRADTLNQGLMKPAVEGVADDQKMLQLMLHVRSIKQQLRLQLTKWTAPSLAVRLRRPSTLQQRVQSAVNVVDHLNASPKTLRILPKQVIRHQSIPFRSP